MKKYLWVILLLINSHANAALMHGIFEGRFGGPSRFDRIPDGDPFQIRFEVDVNPGDTIAHADVILLTGGLRGDINVTLLLADYGDGEGAFQALSNASGASNIFDSQPDATIEFSFFLRIAFSRMPLDLRTLLLLVMLSKLQVLLLAVI